MKQPSLSSCEQGNKTHSQQLQLGPPSLCISRRKIEAVEERKAERNRSILELKAHLLSRGNPKCPYQALWLQLPCPLLGVFTSISPWLLFSPKFMLLPPLSPFTGKAEVVLAPSIPWSWSTVQRRRSLSLWACPQCDPLPTSLSLVQTEGSLVFHVCSFASENRINKIKKSKKLNKLK